jgi:predicted acetyltransferase
LSNDVTATAASEAERDLIEGLFQFYAYDFSEMSAPDSPDFPISLDGRFGPYPYMESYWREAARVPLIIRVRGEPAGFALINDHSPTGAPVDRNMAEFFVMRRYRRGGVGSGAVRAILTGYPGRWQIAIAERNMVAKAFWPLAVAAVPGVEGLVTLQGDGVRWAGPILSFRV